MSHHLRLTAHKIERRIELIRPKVHKTSVPLEGFDFWRLKSAACKPGKRQGKPEKIISGDYWAGADEHFYLECQFLLPSGWQHPALFLPLGEAGDIFCHPEALLRMDGAILGSADRYHHTIELDPKLANGKTHLITLHGWTGWTGWPPDPKDKKRLMMGECAIVDLDPELLALLRLAESALDTASYLNDDQSQKHDILRALDRCFHTLDTRDPMEEAFRSSVPDALSSLKKELSEAGSSMNVVLNAIGHAHMDIAYLWPVEQIRLKNIRTYSNVLRLMERYPQYRFSHSQPQLYAFIKEDNPEIFHKIQSAVSQGKWELLGGMWVEPDVNMTGAEALIRQIMLARSWVNEEFGDVETRVLWLPDSFGFPASLPQIMLLCGLKWFVTNKMNWNQYNRMPSSTTRWQGIDGSQVLAQFLTTPRNVQHLPFPTCYKSDLTAKEVFGTWEQNTARHAVRELPICYGYGDGGGGPTSDLIEKALHFAAMPGAPKMRMSTLKDHFERLEQNLALQETELPLWQGELYLEGHRGCLTSQGWIKRANRQSERALHQAELLFAHVMLQKASNASELPDLKKAWQLLCLNQFHDIITGTSITDVFDQARKDHASITKLTDQAKAWSIAKLAPETPEDETFLVVNATPFKANRYALLPRDLTSPVDTATGEALPFQKVQNGCLIQCQDLPANGWACVMDLPQEASPISELKELLISENGQGVVMQNAYLILEIDQDGMLWRIFDRQASREIIKKGHPANQLQAFEDRPISWDAWDIDIFFEDRMEIISDLQSMEIIETGPLRVALKLERSWRSSRITQTIHLYHDTRRIDFVTSIDWHETHILLKAAFPLTVKSDRASFDIQWGHIERATHSNTSWDAAKFEVCAHNWADLSEHDYGVAILNDGKYGHDVKNNSLRLSLIKSPTMPDPVSDQGRHDFVYSLLPHQGSWHEEVPLAAYDLNAPATPFSIAKEDALHLSSQQAPVTSLSPGVLIETIKPAENGHGIIARLYESYGRHQKACLCTDERIKQIFETSPLEEDEGEIEFCHKHTELNLNPFQILTLRLTW